MIEHGILDVLGALSGGVAIMDSNGRVSASNLELQRILGAGAGEMVLANGEYCARVGELLGFSADAIQLVEDAVSAVLGGEREHLHLEIEVTATEPKRAYLIEGARLPSAGLPSMIFELRDVSQERAQRRSLEHELHLLQALIDAIPSPLFYKDNEGIYLGCNRAFEEYIGLPRERVVGGTVYDVSPKDLADVYHEKDLELMEGREVQIYETPVEYADGTRHEVMFNKAAVTMRDGELAGMVGVMLDITQLKQVEAEVRQREQELRKQNKRMSTPILELGDDIVALPVIGAVDAERAELIMDELLAAVSRGNYQVVILDVTGVDTVNTETAEHFTRVVRAVQLLGAACLLSGISPSVAQAMVALGLDLGAVRTVRNLKQALAAALELLRKAG